MKQNIISKTTHTQLNNEKELVSAVLTDSFEFTHTIEFTSSYSFREIIIYLLDCDKWGNSLFDRILHRVYQNKDVFKTETRQYHSKEYSRIASLVENEIISITLSDVKLVELALETFKEYADYCVDEDREIISPIDEIVTYDYASGFITDAFTKEVNKLIEEVGTRIFLEELEKNPEIIEIPKDIILEMQNRDKRLNRIIHMVKEVRSEDIELLEKYLIRKTK